MIKPIGEYVLIEPDKIEDKTESGIFLPEMKKDRPQTGTVVEDFVTPQKGNTVYIVPKGAKVWFKMWAGEPIEYFKDDKRVKFGKVKKDYLLIHRKDIIAYEDQEGEK